MTEDTGTKPSGESVATAGVIRQRKKRRWDEPADFISSTGISIGNTLGISAPGVLPLSTAIATNTIVPLITQSSATLAQKLIQPKVQDELIAREIVINDAEPTIRYKLTKRQTQEEIQRSTGAIVITRGKYRPPSALPDSEKPLYLHISAGSHLKDMAERIIAVDRAASMVEEMLRQGHNLLSTSGPYPTFSSAGQVNPPLSTCLFLGFEPDPSQNIAARIRGPNDQYINHIINETGATVVLRGLGSGNHGISPAEGMAPHCEDAQQPLHLYLSSTNSMNLEAAKNLAENLLDTISAECGAPRVSSSKVYNAVPPPQQLLAGVVSSANTEVFANPVVSSPCPVPGITQAGQSLASTALAGSSVSSVLPSGVLMPNGNLASCGTFVPNTGSYAYPTLIRGTCYSGYGGIYPQATPLQQVALALKHAPVSTPAVASTASHANASQKMTSNSNANAEKQPPQKRKFQELPAASKGPATATVNKNSRQGSECFKPGLEDAAASSKISSMPPPKKPSQPSLGGFSPPPPPKFPSDHGSRMMAMPPPPPPKFPSDHKRGSMAAPPPPKLPQNPQVTAAVAEAPVQCRGSEKAGAEPVSDTPLKLVEYEEEEEEEEEDMVSSAAAEECCRSNIMRSSGSKPFWAV